MLALVSGRELSIIAGAAVGGAVCVGVMIGALLYMRRRTKPPPDHPPHHHHQHHNPLPRLWRDKRPNTTEVSVAEEERAEFLGQLATLRGEATNFLEMLTHTRNRFRTLRGPDSPTDTKAKAYRAVVRDLSRVLTLLNRREEHIVTVPGDWRRLMSWATRVLARYKRQKAARNGEAPSLQPVSTGGTLYQTRRQAQAQRCRLVTQGAQTSSQLQNSSGDLHQDPEGLYSSYSDGGPLSLMGSRTTSLMSLSPIILEEDEDENKDEVLFEDDIENHHIEENFTKDFDLQHSLEVDFHINNEDLLRGDKIHNETNNNITKHMNHVNRFLSDKHRPSPTTTEKIMNLKNMERLLEANNNDKHILPDVTRHEHNYENHKISEDMFEPKNETKTNQLKSQKSCGDLRLLENDTINAALSGEDVYINIIRKPVMVGLMLAGDPFRDDTVDNAENLKRGAQLTTTNIHPAVSCKAEVRLHMPGPRCELTTEL
ncbi:uncharacterized protein LOC121866980 [Homarus americanus]|uniref:uncharacterized protein LOC121866980 n=1 Tax=Homarus americanus TaxID=6706 RepID=UPI001C44D29B|nr:uncharacterized protein LOC121866980 [Homarus americanus]